MSRETQNRERWLNELVRRLRPWFRGAGYTVPPKVSITVGFPSSHGLPSGRKVRIGECWDASASEDGRYEMFISPIIDEPLTVAATVVHEVGHACVGVEHGHKGPFKRFCRKMDLRGKATATVPGPECTARLNAILAEMPEYPHVRLNASANAQKKQGTRLVKCECSGCGYTVRVTRKWLDRSGAPPCPAKGCGQERMGWDGQEPLHEEEDE